MILLLMACSREPPRTWEVIDPTAVRAVLDAPTATRDDVGGFFEDLVDLAVRALDLSTLPGQTLGEVLAPEDTPDSEVTGDFVSGTQIFLEVACPGEGEGPDPAFAHGVARIESPLLLEQDFTPIVGPLHLSLTACELRETTVNAELRARWIASDQRLLASGSLDMGQDLGEVTTVLDASPGAFLLSVPLGGRTVTIAVLELVVELRFADGISQCIEAAEGLVCTDL